MSVAGISFKTARLRLTLTYLAIIMLLSIGFSAIFYYQSVDEAKGNLENQRTLLDDFLFFTTPDGVSKIHDNQLTNFKQSLIKDLVALNVGMLFVGTLVSAVLARQSLKPLEENVKAQTRFTSDAAHELRTPLTAMKTEIEVNLRDAKLSKAEAVDVLKSNLEEVNKLETMTNALLRLSRIDDGIDTSHWKDYRIDDILKGSLARVQKRADDKFIIILLPKSKLTVHGDPDQLVELFVTLLDNAIKYSPNKSEITVDVVAAGNNVEILVKDQGVGISKADQEKIFDRFYRADQSRNKIKADGYGLGLSLAQAIVATHGGNIEVKSQKNKGSTFVVSLPV